MLFALKLLYIFPVMASKIISDNKGEQLRFWHRGEWTVLGERTN